MDVGHSLVPPSVGLPIARYKQLEAWLEACQVVLFAWKRVNLDASGLSKLRLFMIDQIASLEDADRSFGDGDEGDRTPAVININVRQLRKKIVCDSNRCNDKGCCQLEKAMPDAINSST